MRRGWYARDRFPHRWCSAVAVCLPPRPQTTRSTGPAGSLITARTRRQGRTRENTSRTSPTFATRTPPVVMPKPLRVSRIQARLSLRDPNLGCPTLRPLRAPDRESNQFRYPRRASWHACTKATDATSPSHCRAGVVLARVTTLRCTCDAQVQRRVVTLAKTTPARQWLGEVASVALVQACQDARRGYRNWFDSLSGARKGRKVGHPRFGSRKDHRASIRLTRNGFGITTGGVRVAKVGDVRLVWSRVLPSVPSSVTVIREADGGTT